MNVEFTETPWNDLMYWMDNYITIDHKISDLIKSIKRTPTKGIGKPEPLRYEFKDCWSRRINLEHRLVYKITGKRGVYQIVLFCNADIISKNKP